ncbi:MAG: acetyl-CoA decarbonylase/synthase complex subunit gamma [Clostridiales Family XIII bacterium]|jgi:acetyl-CoA decarbonylase/synthase complex subunit gamma|nr:acetyl-CoA decarbonylase/synthase complex subunit gamma [Clostridiales Family XIII bacterium]
MALKGLDIFKLTPKTNCKDCGQPTCMAFGMKVAQGATTLDKCPHLSEEALAVLGEATAPPMKSVRVGAGAEEYTLGGETVLFRHDKTFVSKSLFAVSVPSDGADDAIAKLKAVDYERISERMYVELAHVAYTGDRAAFLETVKKTLDAGRTPILDAEDADAAKEALELAKGRKPILNAATPSNYEAMYALAKEYGAVLGVKCGDLDVLYDTVGALEKLGAKDMVLDATAETIKDTFANIVQIRRAALKSNDRGFGYPSIVNTAKLAPGNAEMQLALASLFLLKYGSVIIMDGMSYAQALPLFGLRQNIFTDPQKPMTVEPGVYAINGATEEADSALTVDFALTYFIISGEIERSGVPINLLIPDAGGYSVLTAWAAGKLSAGSIAKFIKEGNIEEKIKNRNLMIPGKVAVLKGELEENLPGWNIIVAPNEAVSLVKFLKERKAS